MRLIALRSSAQPRGFVSTEERSSISRVPGGAGGRTPLKMRLRPTLAALLVCAALPATSAAQGVPPSEASDDKKEASAAFAAGERAFEQTDYAAALGYFEKAFALAAHDAIRFNMAVCLERLGRYREALAQYETAAKSQTLGEVDRERARRAADAVRAQVGVLLVPGEAGGGAIIDGGARCDTPCRAVLDPGPHEVIFRQGGTERHVRVVIERGRELVLVPAPKPGPPPATPSSASGPGWLTLGGAALALAGTAGIVGFGLRAQALHDDYVREPTASRRDGGLVARDLANASIGVVVVGAAMVAVDLLFFAPRPVHRTAARAP